MPLARGDKEYSLPFKGLNTEANLLHFPIDFSPDMLNMELDFNPQMIRPRKGLLKSGNERLVVTRATEDHDAGITSFLWEGVGQDADLDFVVVQIGATLTFFDANGLSNPTTSIHSEQYILTPALSGTTKGTPALLDGVSVVMANVKGKLLVTSEQINPVIISWDVDTSTIDPVVLNLNIRDMFGIEDGLEIDEHPVGAAHTTDHLYNLYNQGWFKQRRLTAGSDVTSDPIEEYNTQHSEYPSNADIIWIGMIETDGDLLFDAEWLEDQTFGSSPAARGHYVVDAFNIDRAAIVADPQSSGVTSGGGSSTGGGPGFPIGGGSTGTGGALP